MRTKKNQQQQTDNKALYAREEVRMESGELKSYNMAKRWRREMENGSMQG